MFCLSVYDHLHFYLLMFTGTPSFRAEEWATTALFTHDLFLYVASVYQCEFIVFEQRIERSNLIGLLVEFC